MSSSRSANTNKSSQKHSRDKPILRAFSLSFEKNLNYWLKYFAIFNLRFRWVHIKGYAQTLSITKNTKWMHCYRQFEITCDGSFMDVTKSLNAKWWRGNGIWKIGNIQFCFFHFPFHILVTSHLLPIERQRSPLNALLVNVILFKTCCFIRLYTSY